MGSKYRNSFFDQKRDWSKYKDAVLSYYLKPYLQKVKEIQDRRSGTRKPICIVDMFAGRGEFKGGEPGSPLIIARLLEPLADSGYEVKLHCYETYQKHYDHLTTILRPFPFAQAIQKDCFSDMNKVASLASTHTTLLYIDPCDVNQLVLSQLKLVFDKVRQDQSIEALIVFMARAFLRQAAWARSIELNISDALNDPLVLQADEDDKAMWLDALYDDGSALQLEQLQKTHSVLNGIAGGNYWETIVDNMAVSWEDRILLFVDEYKQKLREWFQCVEALPVSPDSSPLPKYWIAFMTRYGPAFDLFNSAACSMKRGREFNIMNQPGTLFAGLETEIKGPHANVVDRDVKRAAKQLQSIKWQELRWQVCGGRNVGNYTEGEVNSSIKRLLKDGWLSGVPGNKIEEKATLSPTQALKDWVDR